MRGTESFWVKPSAKALYSSLSMTLAFMGHTEMQRKQARHLALSIVRQSSEIAPRGTFTYAFAAFYAGIGSGGAEYSAFAAIFIGPVSRN